MNGGTEFLGWILIFSLVVLAWAINEIVEAFKEDEPLPPPRIDCIARGPVEAWEVGTGHERYARTYLGDSP